MESPVRICLGAALVVNLLLLSSTTVNGNVIPHESNTTTPKTERLPIRGRIKAPDVSINELNSKIKPKVSTSEENAKYKDRGRGNIKFHTLLKSSTEKSNNIIRRVRSTESSKLLIVTPTPEVKQSTEFAVSKLVDKNEILNVTTPTAVKEDEISEEEYEDDDEDNEEESAEKFSSNFDNFFSIPSFGDLTHDSEFDSSNKNTKHDFDSPYKGFSSMFPHQASYSFSEPTHDSFKAEFFGQNYESELTTPKNDFFDKRFSKVSNSILKNLDILKAKTNVTSVQKIVKENIDMGNSSKPGNKTVYIKNTKEIRLLDNDGAGSTKEELSDVHGTSIYYEMSVLSTETYDINNSDDDCDNEFLQSGPTPSTSVEEEQASLNAAQLSLPLATKPALPDPSPEILSTISSSFIPLSSILPIFSTNSVAVSTQNTLSSTDNSKIVPTSYIRSRSYSKRLNLSRNKDSPNSVTSRPVVITSTQSPRQHTRKFHHTTPKTKPVWLVPRRNVTRIRPTISSPIYTEHFSLKAKTTSRPRLSSPFFTRPIKSTLTTVSSDLDPILQGDISGEKKVVQTQSIVDNSVASLSKRGSMKFGASTVSSTELDTESEMPPTAWALASLRIPPASPDTAMNNTKSAQKNVDENELQSVGEVTDKKEIATTSTTTTSAHPISNDIIPKKIVELDLNKVPWQPITESTPKSKTQIETKSEEPATTSNLIKQHDKEETQESIHSDTPTDAPWIPVIQDDETTDDSDYIETETMPPNESNNANGFESITKLAAGITTPSDETVAGSEVNQTVTEEKPQNKSSEYEITTIRFSYVPSEDSTTVEAETETTETIVPTTWHPVFPTRTRITTLKDSPVTTYRPKYVTTDTEDETTTIFIDTSSPIEVSSHVSDNSTKLLPVTSETPIATTETLTDAPTTEQTTEPVTEEITTEPTTMEIVTLIVSTEPTTINTSEINNNTDVPPTTTTEIIEDTTTIVVEVVTEINTERERRITSTTAGPSTTEDITSSEEEEDYEYNSGSNEVITQDTIKSTTTEMNTPKYVTTRPERTTMSSEILESTEMTSEIPVRTKMSTEIPVRTKMTTEIPVITKVTPEIEITGSPTTTELVKETTTQINTKIQDTTMADTTTDAEYTTKSVSELEDLTSYTGELTTEHAPVKMDNEEGSESGAGIAIAVSTIGVIALILLIGLLLIVRRRGRRGVYAQRCTPVSLDAYSLDSVSVGHRKGNHRLRASKRSYGNPAYDDEVTSHPMQYAALANFALDVESMTAEFSEIPSVTVRPDEVPPGCEDKNRYSNVLPLPETRVPLKRIGNDPTTEYINANYITGPGNIRNYYIACQAPLSNTVVDFWRMIWEQNSRLIVMLTEYMENGVEKCFEYLPPSEISDNKRTFGDFKIILKKREQRDKYAVSSVQLINLATRTWREVTHLWYFWPAKGVPEDYDSVIDFLCEMRSFMKMSQTAKEYDEEGVEVLYGDQSRSSFSNLSKFRSEEPNSGNGVNVYSPARAEEQLRRVPPSNGTLGRMKAASDIEGIRPCVVTCASGSGRTAALVALDICTRALPGAADVPRVVRHLRAQRPHSLSNRHHYIFVYKVLSEYGNKMLGGGVDTI